MTMTTINDEEEKHENTEVNLEDDQYSSESDFSTCISKAVNHVLKGKFIIFIQLFPILKSIQVIQGQFMKFAKSP